MIDVYQQNGIDFFSCIKDIIEKKFEQEVRRADSFQIPEDTYDALRHQYHAHKIIAAISARGVNNGFNLGVVQDDIFVHRMNFVFGLADRRSRTALVSSYRLAGTNLIDRLSKEIVHELGHFFGLSHTHGGCGCASTAGCTLLNGHWVGDDGLADTLREQAGATAFVAHGERLRDVLGVQHQRWNRLERPAEVVEIETGDDHSFAGGRQRHDHLEKPLVEELALVDPDDDRAILDRPKQLLGVSNRLGLRRQVRMGNHLGL